MGEPGDGRLGRLCRGRNDVLGGVGVTGHRRTVVLAGLVLHTSILVVLVVFVGGLSNRVNKVEAERAAERAAAVALKKATIQSDYKACVKSIKTNAQINGFVAGAEFVANVILENARAMHEITDPSAKNYRQQIINITNLSNAIAVGSGIRLPVPTVESCKATRAAALAQLAADDAARDKALHG